MSMGGRVPKIVVLALGAGALGGPDALQLLLAFAGRNAVLDIATCVLLIALVTAHLLGAVTLARFVRKARTEAGAGARRSASGAPASNIFDRVMLMLSLCVGFLITACLLVVPLVAPGGQGIGSVRLLVVALGVGAAAVTCTRALLRMYRDAGNAGAAVPVARATGRFGTAIRPGWSLVAAGLVLAITFIAHSGPDAPRFFNGRDRMFLGVATVIAVGVPLLVCFPRFRGAGQQGHAAGVGCDVPGLPAAVSFALICLVVTIASARARAALFISFATHRAGRGGSCM